VPAELDLSVPEAGRREDGRPTSHAAGGRVTALDLLGEKDAQDFGRFPAPGPGGGTDPRLRHCRPSSTPCSGGCGWAEVRPGLGPITIDHCMGGLVRSVSNMRSDHPPRVPRRHLEVVNAVLAAIRDGKLGAGARLPSDRELSERLGVSRLTAREGILALELAGMIEVRPGAGAFVRDHGQGAGGLAVLPAEGERSPEELIEARIALEPAIAHLCALHASKAQVRELRAVITRAEVESGPEGDVAAFVQLGLGFHTELAECCGNRFLATFCRSLVSVTDHPLWALLNQHAVRSQEARRGQVEQHRRIIDAIATGDGEAASDAMTAHLRGLEAAVFGT
jgi:DNA-binding FadR family transcriptional regulator